MAKYLYGASVQGIQSFIFQTNKLKEIVGASELVAEICDKVFINEVIQYGEFNENQLLIGAAGNIKYLFENKEECEKVVRSFPKAAMGVADGITISQAVVESGKYEDDIQELEKRLRIQRNRAISVRDKAGLMITETARRTGGVGCRYVKKEVIDLGQIQKLKASEAANKRLAEDIFESGRFKANQFPFDISDMIKVDENQSWIAVIHADGNSLGKKLIKIGSILKEEAAKEAFKDFSERLDRVTKKAAREAFNIVIAKEVEDKKLKRIPFRPVVLGGDDLTAIIRGDLALVFTEKFLEEFEKASLKSFEDFDSRHKLGEIIFSNGLTTCAGIAYIKANYPFHYGVKLAESLCQEAKKASKKINGNHAPSSIMFHKVHASFIEDFEDIIEKELRAQDKVFFNYGPYFIREQASYDTVHDLKERIRELKRKDAPKSGLRNWLTELQNNPDMADQTLERLRLLNSRYKDRLNLAEPFIARETKIQNKKEPIIGKFTPIFDAIALSNI